MEILGFTQFFGFLVVILVYSWLYMRLRRKHREDWQKASERMDEFVAHISWTDIQRNVLAKAMWLAGVRGIMHVSILSPDDGSRKNVTVSVTARAVTVSSPGETEYAIRMAENEE